MNRRGSAKRATVRELAAEAGMDTDEALIAIWDAGITHVIEPTAALSGVNLNRIRRILGLATRKDFLSRGYWRAVFQFRNDQELDALIVELGIEKRPGARSLPRKAVTRLKGEARRRGIDPMTGLQAAGLPTDVATAPPKSQRRVSEWVCPGHERNLSWLDVEDVDRIHWAIAEDFANTSDPIRPAGIRSADLLASAVFRPQTSLGSVLKYPTVEGSAAALLCAIIHDHPFINGNKRTALVAMLVFLDRHGFIPTCNEGELFQLLLLVAQHRMTEQATANIPDEEVMAVANWLQERVRPVEVGDHPLPFRKLRAILSAFDCELERPAGNRIRITRYLQWKGVFGIRRSTRLRSNVSYTNEGREVEKRTIKNLRHDLHLDEEHGVDSRDFYKAAGNSTSEFIVKYRKTLRRLAKV